MADDGAYAVGTGEASGPSEAHASLVNFWPKVSEEIKNLQTVDFRNQDLPLARIKKIMKLDEDVRMISAEAPLLFAKAAEIFISELSLRAWIHTEDNKRRTLQRNDIALAVSKYDQFDFLIDIVPREEGKPVKRETTQGSSEPVQYIFQVAGQTPGAAAVAAPTATPGVPGASGSVPGQPAALQLVGTQPAAAAEPQQLTAAAPQPLSSSPQSQQVQPQVYQQVMTSTGEMQTVPIQLSEAQMQAIRLQMQGKQAGQPVVLQTQAPGDHQFVNTAVSQAQQPTALLQQGAAGTTTYFQPGESRGAS